jgi:hypothetical protein
MWRVFSTPMSDRLNRAVYRHIFYREFGWTYEDILNTPPMELALQYGIIDGEARAAKVKSQRGRNH